MEIFVKCAAMAIFTVLISVLIKKYTPELSLLLSIVVAVLIITSTLGIIKEVKEALYSTLRTLVSSNTFIEPVLKCMGIGMISKMSADISREAAQPAVATSLEYAGVLCASAVALPMVSTLLKMLGAVI